MLLAIEPTKSSMAERITSVISPDRPPLSEKTSKMGGSDRQKSLVCV